MPAVAPDGDVVVASLSGRVARLSPEGAERWSVELGDRAYASPLLTRDVVIVGSDAKKVLALTAGNGRKRWELDVDGEADTAPADTPDGDIVVAAGPILYRLRADGTVRFRVKVPKKIYGSPAVADDGTVYFGAQDHKLYAVSSAGVVALDA
jgi:outer membrane protein assembly factor BamB